MITGDFDPVMGSTYSGAFTMVSVTVKSLSAGIVPSNIKKNPGGA